MTTAIYGYDLTTGLYWYKIQYMGVEVETGKGLTRTQLEEVKRKNQLCSWYRDYDYAF
jgi:N6-adenosine-specific RNA methylase IME4